MLIHILDIIYLLLFHTTPSGARESVQKGGTRKKEDNQEKKKKDNQEEKTPKKVAELEWLEDVRNHQMNQRFVIAFYEKSVTLLE